MVGALFASLTSDIFPKTVYVRNKYRLSLILFACSKCQHQTVENTLDMHSKEKLSKELRNQLEHRHENTLFFS